MMTWLVPMAWTNNPSVAAPTVLRWQRPLGLALLVVCWFAMRPYVGIRHDGLLYTMQAFRNLQPEIWQADLFFMFGSQDSFTLFSKVHALVIASLGLQRATLLMQLLLSGLQALAVWVLMRRVIDDWRWALVAALGVATYPVIYSDQTWVGYTEAYVTARSAAEPVGLLALALFATGTPKQRLIAVGLALLMPLLHPLMALAVWAVGWLMLVMHDRRWLAMLLGVPVLLGLAWADIAPFRDLLNTYDPAWWEAVDELNPLSSPSHWSPRAWSSIPASAIALVLVRPYVVDPARRLLDAVIVWALLGCAMSLVAVDGLRNVLLTGLQLWRGNWLLQLMAAGLGLVACLRLLRESTPTSRMAGAFLAMAYLAGEFAAGLVCACMAWISVRCLRAEQVTPLMLRASYTLLGLVLLLVAADGTHAGYSAWLAATDDGLLSAVVQMLQSYPVSLLVGGLVIVLLVSGWTASAAVLLTVLAVLVGAGYDQRSPWLKYIESEQHPPAAFKALMAPTDTVLWSGEPRGSWLWLRQPNYWNSVQSGGLLFNRQTALTYLQRREAMLPVHTVSETCRLFQGMTGHDTCSFDLEVLAEVCVVPQGPDWIISTAGSDAPAAASMQFQVPGEAFERQYFLYSCNVIRSQGRAGSAPSVGSRAGSSAAPSSSATTASASASPVATPAPGALTAGHTAQPAK